MVEIKVEEHQVAMFAAWLRDRQRALGLTQQELAQRADVSLSYLNAIMNGKKVPTPKIMTRIAQGLEDTTILDQLFGEDFVQTTLMFSKYESPAFPTEHAGEHVQLLRELAHLEAVSAGESLEWWGIRPEHLLFIERISVNEIKAGELLYLKKSSGEHQFAFAGDDPLKPFAEPPEIVYGRAAGLQFWELRDHGIADRDVEPHIPLPDDWTIYRIVSIMRNGLNRGMRPFPIGRPEQLKEDSYQLLTRQANYMMARDQDGNHSLPDA